MTEQGRALNRRVDFAVLFAPPSVTVRIEDPTEQSKTAAVGASADKPKHSPHKKKKETKTEQ
jgi:hypothetical protein